MGEDFNSPKYGKFLMLLKCHLPEGAVRQKMEAEGHSQDIIDAFFDHQSSSPTTGGGAGSGGDVKQDPRYAKYFKMLSMHLPRGAVEQVCMC